MKAIFLDIDGVLNNDKTNSRGPSGCVGIGNSQLDKLYHIVKETGAEIILTSTWKSSWDKNPNYRDLDGMYLNKKFTQKGMFLKDKIDDSKTGMSNRGAAIKLYLDKHPEIEEYLILDDFEFDFEKYEDLNANWIQTESAVGLTSEHVDLAIDILNRQELIQEIERER